MADRRNISTVLGGAVLLGAWLTERCVPGLGRKIMLAADPLYARLVAWEEDRTSE